MSRRFPPPWTVHQSDGAYWVEDALGRRFGFCYFRDDLVRMVTGDGYLTSDEARRLAANIAKLPDLLRR